MKINRRGQITIPNHLPDQYGLTLGTEVEIIERPTGLLIRKRETRRHPVWDFIGYLGQEGDTDTYMEKIRGR
jgi:bifunctional DNA-binding transcriptional regulator/antitoxin component of YhaV-PrlF toxin-antitoxin module